MSYYTVFHDCPFCGHEQERWIVSGQPDLKEYDKCDSCLQPFDLTQTMSKIKFKNPTE